jgi:hypothetical protein
MAKTLRYLAFGFMTLFGVLGTLFVAGYAFEDPGGWAAVAMTVPWVVPMVAAYVLALRRPDTAAPVLSVATVVVLAFTLLDALVGIIPRDDWGPVAAVSVFALGVALAALGLHRSTLAGTLLMTAAGVQLLATATGFAVHEPGDGPGLGAMLGGSSGVVVMPLLLAGAAFWLAGRTEHQPLGPVWHQPHPAH